MDSPRQMWLKRRGKVSFELIALSLAGNSLMGLVIGIVASDALRPWGWGLIGAGLVIDGLAKWRYLGGFPKKGIKTIWLERRGNLNYGLLFALMTGKTIFFIGVGVFTAQWLAPYLSGIFTTALVIGTVVAMQFFKIKE